LPSRRRNTRSATETQGATAPVRSLWSGTITFGLVSIPVDLLTAIRPRQTAMKLVDKAGHPLGRQYHCSRENKKLDLDELVRGYETQDGKLVVVTDEEFESVAPEMSSDIELRNFVPLEQIPPLYFQRPYFLAPSGKSTKAYNLLTATMERTGRAGIGSFVMRAHEYLVAIIPDHGVLRADTLRYADELRTPESIGLPKQAKAPAGKVAQFARAIDELTRDELDVTELEDHEADELLKLAETKREEGKDVIRLSGRAEEEDAEDGGGAQVIDLMEVLRKSLSKNAKVTTAQGTGTVVSLAERRAQRDQSPQKSSSATKKKTATKRKSGSKASAPRRRTRRS